MLNGAGKAHPCPRILIVDEDEANLALLTRRLGVRRCTVATAHSGKEALGLLKSAQPDLILLDMLANGPMSGIETLQRIRSGYGLSELPVMLLTASDDRQAMLTAIREGANDYLSKPVDFELLMARIAVHMNVQASFRESISERSRLQRRLETRARLEKLGFGDPQKRVYLVNELLRGMNEGRVHLAYQPQLRLRGTDANSAEALMRWDHPTLGHIPTDQFIPIAEETGEIAALTEWAVARALDDHARFAAAGHDVRIAVNLSAALAGDAAFTDTLLARMAGRSEAISLELTESAIFEDPEKAIENLRRYSKAGIRLAIDDYGTGMSSLSYIQKLPVHELKIDRMFVSKLTNSHRDPLLVRSTIDLAHALDFEVVAEGVEDGDTLALLKAMGCDLAQGYFVGAPMRADEYIAYLRDDARQMTLKRSFDSSAVMQRLMDAYRQSA